MTNTDIDQRFNLLEKEVTELNRKLDLVMNLISRYGFKEPDLSDRNAIPIIERLNSLKSETR